MSLLLQPQLRSIRYVWLAKRSQPTHFFLSFGQSLISRLAILRWEALRISIHDQSYTYLPVERFRRLAFFENRRRRVASRRVVQSDAGERHRTLLAGCGSELRRLQPPSLFVELTGVAQLGLSPREWPTCIMLVSEESRVVRSPFFLTMRWAPERGAGRRTAKKLARSGSRAAAAYPLHRSRGRRCKQRCSYYEI